MGDVPCEAYTTKPHNVSPASGEFRKGRAHLLQRPEKLEGITCKFSPTGKVSTDFLYNMKEHNITRYT
jgi:hypothetical protein